MYSLILGQDNAADQSRLMQEQMAGAAMTMPPDPNKAFKSEWEALEIVEHKWALENVEEELMSRDLNFGNFFSQDIKSPML
nr:ER membrane protein complex subunit 3-like [Scatophagus argus]